MMIPLFVVAILAVMNDNGSIVYVNALICVPMSWVSVIDPIVTIISIRAYRRTFCLRGGGASVGTTITN
jgi:hypothetical protein